ncbi:MAG: flagellar basal body-associated FliL family protein [Candidatus Jidaibacter sp.]|jgi:flagellar FliL protein|nr:flagellar basal body-associated FliL family protein [Candidatus Jidaibacter sp.]
MFFEDSTNAHETEGEKASTSPEGGSEASVSKTSPKKKKIILIAAILILAAVAAGIGFFLKKHKEKELAEINSAQQEESKQQIFHDMDEIIVNLNTDGKSVSFLKLTVTLDIQGKDNLDVVIKLTPRIKDVFQVYLREVRPSEMQGSAGLYRLREELLLRINKLIYPAKVNDILFKEVLIQ